MRLTLTDIEAAELKETLVTVLDDLAVELRRTEGHDYRRLLKIRRDTLHGILVQLDRRARRCGSKSAEAMLAGGDPGWGHAGWGTGWDGP